MLRRLVVAPAVAARPALDDDHVRRGRAQLMVRAERAPERVRRRRVVVVVVAARRAEDLLRHHHGRGRDRVAVVPGRRAVDPVAAAEDELLGGAPAEALVDLVDGRRAIAVFHTHRGPRHGCLAPILHRVQAVAQLSLPTYYLVW